MNNCHFILPTVIQLPLNFIRAEKKKTILTDLVKSIHTVCFPPPYEIKSVAISQRQKSLKKCRAAH